MFTQKMIVNAMKVDPKANLEVELRKRIDFIKNMLENTGMKHLVLGISGGVDSLTAGRLCQLAVNELNYEVGVGHEFIAVRLPYGNQLDEDDAQTAIKVIEPTRVVKVDIAAAVIAAEQDVIEALNASGINANNPEKNDFVKGNIKARTRMVIQYTIANQVNGLVVGTDHSAEATMGFYTKFGDGACDLAPLFGLNKRQVRGLAKMLGAPEQLYGKPATADLEELAPQALDEDRLGVTYDELDDFLEGKTVNENTAMRIKNQYVLTEHKRAPIPTPA
ncbi:ammonia-dependent NAD(+) synthetase [Pleionea mediterranea]|uniref:NH(3)-dependent NAD(+) synthetase n=1 Tax=Pleionea mediterranea TaxID=523701 RepID=A0A316FMY5_9GAMM|nr:ammonia-dependent NAD(+) synthetase [Pleionea mediterranea]PWK49869.1 NH(3)-dependent NAD(+) synthetase [Pleionea mediterranea]